MHLYHNRSLVADARRLCCVGRGTVPDNSYRLQVDGQLRHQRNRRWAHADLCVRGGHWVHGGQRCVRQGRHPHCGLCRRVRHRAVARRAAALGRAACSLLAAGQLCDRDAVLFLLRQSSHGRHLRPRARRIARRRRVPHDPRR
eukprot:Amastigsp_a841639_12.p4 type:complete len:143 gc:universal Amastigsp_a841639_12:654-226(-)